MKFKNILTGIAIFLIVVTALLVLADRRTQAQDTNFESLIYRKLEEVTTSQREILARISDMKQDIAIIKIRVTQSQ